MSSRGVLLFARNNSTIDYVKQAVFLANRIKQYLNIPTSIVTDSVDYLKDNFDSSIFDRIIPVEYENSMNNRRYSDGALHSIVLNFKNDIRSKSFDLSPYDETIVMDTDYIISNNLLTKCFDSNQDLMLFKKSEDLAGYRDTFEFKYVSNSSIDFYWATVVFFRKTSNNKVFFDLISHISENWSHYRSVYQIDQLLFRNDYAFSIAVHIMNGFTDAKFAGELPGKLFYITDQDLLISLNEDKMKFLVQRENHLGEYTALSTHGQNIHVMNKFSLGRIIDDTI